MTSKYCALSTYHCLHRRKISHHATRLRVFVYSNSVLLLRQNLNRYVLSSVSRWVFLTAIHCFYVSYYPWLICTEGRPLWHFLRNPSVFVAHRRISAEGSESWLVMRFFKVWPQSLLVLWFYRCWLFVLELRCFCSNYRASELNLRWRLHGHCFKHTDVAQSCITSQSQSLRYCSRQAFAVVIGIVHRCVKHSRANNSCWLRSCSCSQGTFVVGKRSNGQALRLTNIWKYTNWRHVHI